MSTRLLSPWLQGLGACVRGQTVTLGSFIGGKLQKHTKHTRASEHTQMRSDARNASTRAYVLTHTLNAHAAQNGAWMNGPYLTHRTSAVQ
jgi:hypothetical protein